MRKRASHDIHIIFTSSHNLPKNNFRNVWAVSVKREGEKNVVHEILQWHLCAGLVPPRSLLFFFWWFRVISVPGAKHKNLYQKRFAHTHLWISNINIRPRMWGKRKIYTHTNVWRVMKNWILQADLMLCGNICMFVCNTAAVGQLALVESSILNLPPVHFKLLVSLLHISRRFFFNLIFFHPQFEFISLT